MAQAGHRPQPDVASASPPTPRHFTAHRDRFERTAISGPSSTTMWASSGSGYVAKRVTWRPRGQYGIHRAHQYLDLVELPGVEYPS